MALLKSIASGNFTSASTWAVCTAVNDGTATSAIGSLTTYTLTSASTYSSTITGNATGVLLKIATRPSTTGTVTAALANNAGTILAECTMNVTDVAGSSLPTTGTTSQYGHWVFFKFNTPVAITSGTFYRIGFRTSVASTLSFNRNSSSAGVHASAIVTDVTQAPAATDRLIIVGDNVADAVSPGSVAGTKVSYTVTMDNTTTTQFGDGGAATLLGIPYWSLYVGDNATLAYGNNAATNYNLRVRGNVAVGAGGDLYKGTFTMGTVADPIPRDSTATLEIDNAAAGSHVLSIQGGVFIAQGLSRTIGKDVDRCLLNADAAAGATSLTVDTDTGWLNGDQIYISQTNRSATLSAETRTLNLDATATSLSITPSLTAAREGNSTIQASIALLTRNVVITGVTNQFYAYVVGAGSVVDCDWVRFNLCGTGTTGRQGIYLDGNSALLSFDRCIFSNVFNGLIWSTANGGAGITNCIVASCTGTGIVAQTLTGISTTITNLWLISLSGGIAMRDIFPISDIRIAGASSYGISFSTLATQLTSTVTLSNIVIHSTLNGIQGQLAQDIDRVILSNLQIQRCTSSGFNIQAATGFIVDNFRIWGNSARNIYNTSGCGICYFRNGYIASQAVNTTIAGIEWNTITQGVLVFEDCQFGTGFTGAQAHTGQDIYFPNPTSGVVILRNCVLGSTPEVSTPIYNNGYIISENHDQVAGAKRVYLKRGRIDTDTAIIRSGSRSLRLIPNSLGTKLEYIFAKSAVASGTTPTIGIYVRKSVVGDGAAYNGNQPRLIIRRNILVGITTDTVIATATNAANGAWELLSGSLPTLTGNGIVEIELDCDGTTGWVNIDDFQAPPALNTKSFEFGDDTVGITAIGDNSYGGTTLIGKSTLIG